MKRLIIVGLFCIALGPLVGRSLATPAEVALITDSTAQAVIYVAPEVMASDMALPGSMPFVEREAELQRRRLRDSVRDLAFYLEKISGTEIEVRQGPPKPADQRLPIWVGDYAVQEFGKPKVTAPYRQGWRLVVSKKGMGLMGESNESASYAIYELLDRLGCRWFMPGELGEVIPQSKSIILPEMDLSGAPSTSYRDIWYADDAFKRRNRQGGFLVPSGHALESYITKEQRKEHPEWRAIIGGKPHPTRLKWSHPGVAAAVADAIIAILDKNYIPAISLSPEDGGEFDESDDKAWDAGDWDPSMETVSITDRYLKFCNLVARRVNQKYPDVLFGFLAYVQYTRPPVREKPDSHLVPQIAPITYCRAHAMTDEAICPSRPQLRSIIEGWARVAPRITYYNYMYNLAETSVPYPMMHQMSEELPIIYHNNVQFWRPETQSNFASVLPGMWLALRMAWNKDLVPEEVFDELFSKFYGSTEKPMRRYWQIFDDAWSKVPAHAGGGFSYMRRFTPEVMATARAAMNEALTSAQTVMEYRRVKCFDASLRQFERFMQLRRDLAEGRLTNLDLRSTAWLGTQIGLAEEYAGSYSFGQPPMTPATFPGVYFKLFWEPAYLDAVRLADGKRGAYFQLLKSPLRQWRYQFVKARGTPDRSGIMAGDGKEIGWQQSDFDDKGWKMTDTCIERWADLGLLNDFGTMWYRTQVNVPKIKEGKKVLLWIASVDNTAKLFVNGKDVPYINAKGEKVDEGVGGFTNPLSFDITAAIKSGEMNQITIASTRDFVRELGTGGLMGPVYLFSEK